MNDISCGTSTVISNLVHSRSLEDKPFAFWILITSFCTTVRPQYLTALLKTYFMTRYKGILAEKLQGIFTLLRAYIKINLCYFLRLSSS